MATSLAEALVKSGLASPPPPEETSESLCIVCLGPALFPDKYCSTGCRLLDQFGFWEESLDKAYGCIIVPRRKEH